MRIARRDCARSAAETQRKSRPIRLTRRSKRHEFNGRRSTFFSCKVPGILKRSRRAVLIQVSAINRVSQTLALYRHGADRDFAISHLNRTARFVEKRAVSTVWFHAPRSDQDAVFHDHKPYTDEAVRPHAGAKAQTLTLLEKG